LVAAGYDVICLDNFRTGSRRNLEHLLGDRHLEIVSHDITQPYYAIVDRIFNLACPASPVHYQANPIATLKTNVLGSLNLLGVARRNSARIFQASTSEVYGDPEVHPQDESYRGNVSTTGIRSCYDEGKRCAEALFFDYHRVHGVDIRVVRIFNTYGPRMHPNDGRVVSNFIRQALVGEDLTIYGDGSQTRSFCFVDDLIDGFMRYMDLQSPSHAPLAGPINLGNPEEFTMLELAEKVLRLTSSRSRLVRMPLPADDPARRRPDISAATRMLDGWRPKIALEDGLRETVAYFKHRLAS
jgi:UDP-glucuronate decarboxylase